MIGKKAEATVTMTPEEVAALVDARIAGREQREAEEAAQERERTRLAGIAEHRRLSMENGERMLRDQTAIREINARHDRAKAEELASYWRDPAAYWRKRS